MKAGSHGSRGPSIAPVRNLFGIKIPNADADAWSSSTRDSGR
jgi:hypothetical protein